MLRFVSEHFDCLDSYIQNKGDSSERPISASTRVSSKYCDGYDNERESMSSTFTEGFGATSNKKIPELPNKCVLDFNKSENEILKEIAEIIHKEQSELEEEIQNQQDLIMNQGKPKFKQEIVDIDQPTSKELYDFKSRLEVGVYIKPVGNIYKIGERIKSIGIDIISADKA